jgi:hypothetical protein
VCLLYPCHWRDAGIHRNWQDHQTVERGRLKWPVMS